MITDPELFTAAWNSLQRCITTTQHTAWGVTMTKSGPYEVAFLGTALTIKDGKPALAVTRLMLVDPREVDAAEAMKTIAQLNHDLAILVSSHGAPT